MCLQQWYGNFKSANWLILIIFTFLFALLLKLHVVELHINFKITPLTFKAFISAWPYQNLTLFHVQTSCSALACSHFMFVLELTASRHLFPWLSLTLFQKCVKPFYLRLAFSVVHMQPTIPSLTHSLICLFCCFIDHFI